VKCRQIQQDKRRGTYYVQIRREGVRRRFELGSGIKKARSRLRAIEKDIQAGRIQFLKQETSASVNGERRDIDVAELVIRHLKWVKVHRSAGTFKLRQHYCFQFLKFLKVGHMQEGRFEITSSMPVSELTRFRLTDFHQWARQRGNGHTNAGNQYLRQVKTMLRWGEEEELCDLPFRRFPRITEVPPETKRVDFDDLAKLFEKAPEDLVDMVKFGLLTGLRPQELRDLKVEHIVKPCSDMWYVRIERHKTAGRTNEKVVRTVPLCLAARDIFERQMVAHPKSRYVFLNSDGMSYTRTVLRNRLIRWCRRAEVPDITPYALRHTFASLESDAHVESTALARLMGHSTVRTLARYISNSSEHDLQAVQAAETALDHALKRVS